MLGAGQSYKFIFCILLSLLTCPAVGRLRTEEDVDGEACDILLTRAVASFFSASEGGASGERAIIWLRVNLDGSGEEQLDFKCSFISSTTDPQEAQWSSREPTTLFTTAPPEIGGALWLLPHLGHGCLCLSMSTAHMQHRRLLHAVITGLSTTHMHFLHCRSESGMLCDGGRNRLSDRGWRSSQLGCVEDRSESIAVGGLPRIVDAFGRPPSLIVWKC